MLNVLKINLKFVFVNIKLNFINFLIRAINRYRSVCHIMSKDQSIDNVLLNRLNLGDYSAFSIIYERHISSLYTYAKKIQMDMEDAEDAIQDIFASLWIRRAEVRILDLRLWLFNSLRKQMLYRLRKKKYQHEFSNYVNFFAEEYKSENHIIGDISYKELLNAIVKELDSLSPQKRNIFFMSRFQSKSHKEIAQDLEISELTVKKQINTVLKVFRKKFDYKTFFTFIYSLIIFSATS